MDCNYEHCYNAPSVFYYEIGSRIVFQVVHCTWCDNIASHRTNSAVHVDYTLIRVPRTSRADRVTVTRLARWIETKYDSVTTRRSPFADILHGTRVRGLPSSVAKSARVKSVNVCRKIAIFSDVFGGRKNVSWSPDENPSTTAFRERRRQRRVSSEP